MSSLHDSDQDTVANNLLAPAMVFENQLCAGDALETDLLWPDSENTRALGAHLTLHTNNGTYEHEVRAAVQGGDPSPSLRMTRAKSNLTS